MMDTYVVRPREMRAIASKLQKDIYRDSGLRRSVNGHDGGKDALSNLREH
jgi:hypothetical protein